MQAMARVRVIRRIWVQQFDNGIQRSALNDAFAVAFRAGAPTMVTVIDRILLTDMKCKIILPRNTVLYLSLARLSCTISR